MALAHAVVKQSVPAKGAVLAAAPKEIVITFNEKVEKLFSTATLKTGAGETVPTDKASVDAANPAVLRLPVPVLTSGKYVVHWTAVGHDGHRLAEATSASASSKWRLPRCCKWQPRPCSMAALPG
ncbi:copper resistance protein CopC [Massilia sp. H-1]|nr:copper resistance protein CopC [Massilia sp. H-1]